ncbi:MAG TPA: SPOR domain-containing protein [Sphingomicrobium sp.]|jgi:tetratricopeptide (TPR) repeat protein|nr:SPOR domain-containing protein [Sphingomicrobium sp.]
MASQISKRVQVAALILTLVATALAAIPVRASAQYAHAQSLPPGEILSRYVRQLASSPRDFNALIGAGKAALELGDTQAAAGFFGRAEEVNPASPLPQAGMGAALAHEGNANGALRYFASAIQFGATPMIIGADRGLAFDLLGRHDAAQADYRAALAGPDADEARRRLALSLAISGRKDEALATLGPLMARGDAAAARTRAFVLALTGDQAGARAMLEARMPGSSAHWGYFFQRLPTLPSGQKAAAVHLGIFPGQPGMAAATPPSGGGDRLASIDQLLSGTSPSPPATSPQARAPVQVQVQPQIQQPVQMANIPPQIRRDPVTATPSAQAEATQRYWVQLASGRDPEAFAEQFRRIKSRNPDVLAGISGYVAESPDRSRLLIGPFRNASEARIFAGDLVSISVSAFSWTSPAGQVIRRLPSE